MPQQAFDFLAVSQQKGTTRRRLYLAAASPGSADRHSREFQDRVHRGVRQVLTVEKNLKNIGAGARSSRHIAAINRWDAFTLPPPFPVRSSFLAVHIWR